MYSTSLTRQETRREISSYTGIYYYHDLVQHDTIIVIIYPPRRHSYRATIYNKYYSIY